MDRDWIYNVSSFIPDRLSAPGPREAALLRPLLTASALELLSELGIPIIRRDTNDTAEQSVLLLSPGETVVDRPKQSAEDGGADHLKPDGDTASSLQALTVVEALFFLQWSHLDWPQTDLDALLSWWGGEAARKHRRQQRPRGLDRVYFGRAASGRARRRLKQLLQETELGAAALGA